VLCSPDRGNTKDAGIGLSVLCAEHFERKIPSPEKVRRKKMPDQTPSTSLLVDAFQRRIKERKDSVNILENGRPCKALGSLYPKGRNEKCLGVTRAPLSCGNSWEQKTDCMDLEDASLASDKWVSLSEADTRKACARNNGTANNTSPCQKPGLPMKLSHNSAESKFRLSLEALCRERRRKKHDPSQAKQVSKHGGSSPNALRTSSEMTAGIWKSQPIPSHCLISKMSSGRSKQIDFPGKRKHTAMSVDAKSSEQSEVSNLSDSACSRSSAKCKNRRSDFVKNILLKSASGDVLQLREAAALPRHDSTLSEEYLNSSNENEKNNWSSAGPGKNNHISVVDTKENQLQVANSRFFLEKSLPFSQEKSTVLPSFYHLPQTKGVKSNLQNAGLSQVLDGKKEQGGKRLERRARYKSYSIQCSNSFSKTKDKTLENASDSCSVEGSRKLALSEEPGKSVSCSSSFKEVCMNRGHISSQLSEELKAESACTDKSKLNGKSKSSFDGEDESLERSLDDDDDDDDEVVFMPLQEILSSGPKPQTGTLEEHCLDSFSQDTATPLLKLHVSG
uniref:SLF2 protein n=1 Tax=Athene cunicularia TaxID=194338 RepID=A0A663MFV4_ATHCN